MGLSGPVAPVAEMGREDVERLARRCLDDPAEFLAMMEGEPSVTLRMRPKRWYSTDYRL